MKKIDSRHSIFFNPQSSARSRRRAHRHKNAICDRRGAPPNQISGLGARSRTGPKAPNAALLGDTRVERTPPAKK